MKGRGRRWWRRGGGLLQDESKITRGHAEGDRFSTAQTLSVRRCKSAAQEEEEDR